MEKPVAEFYLEQLKKDTNPVKVLVNFYSTLFDITDKTNLYRSFARLYKIYGAELLYFALLDCADLDNINFNSITRLISYFCKKRLNERFNFQTEISLEKLAEENIKKMSKKRRIKIPEPFEDENE
jgi:hypothetical protein